MTPQETQERTFRVDESSVRWSVVINGVGDKGTTMPLPPPLWAQGHKGTTMPLNDAPLNDIPATATMGTILRFAPTPTLTQQHTISSNAESQRPWTVTTKNAPASVTAPVSTAVGKLRELLRALFAFHHPN